MSTNEIQQKVSDLIDKETRGMTNASYRETLEGIITECEVRLDALSDDERRARGE